MGVNDGVITYSELRENDKTACELVLRNDDMFHYHLVASDTALPSLPTDGQHCCLYKIIQPIVRFFVWLKTGCGDS